MSRRFTNKYVITSLLFIFMITSLLFIFMITSPFLFSELDRYQQSNYFRNNMCWINIPSLYYSFLLILFLVLVYNAYLVFLIANKAFFSKKKVINKTKKSCTYQVFIFILTIRLEW